MAITYYAGNRLTGVSGDTKPTSNVLTGTTFLETNTDDLYLWDGDSWNIIASDTGAQTFTNKTFTDAITFKEMSAPGDQADTYGALYIKAKSSSNAVYFKADDETEYDLTESASAGSLSGMSDTTITSPSDAALLLYDTGTSKWRDADMSGIATISDVGAIALAVNAITDQSAETTPQGASDLILMYDNSASALKKITVSNLLAGGVSADTLSALNDTTIASVASAQVLIYDGTDSWDNKTVSGDVTINTSGVTAIGTDKVTGTMIHANAVDDSSLEQSGTTFRVKATGVTNAMLAGSIANAKLSNSAITIGGTSTSLGGTITALTALTDLDLTSGNKTIFDTVGANTLTIGASGTTVTMAGNLTVTGDLTVSGDTTTVNTATVTIEDPLMALANNNTTNSVDIGFYGKYRTNGTDLYTGLVWDGSASQYILFHANQAAPSTTVNTGGTGHAVSTLVANITGNVSGSSGTSTGLAGSATILATGRTIAASGDITWTSASFNGSANVTSVAAITADVIVNADVKSDAAIVDTKLATIATSNKVGLNALDIDGGTEIGANIIDADLFIIDDGAGGTNRKTLASRLKTYIGTLGDVNEYAFKTISVSGQSNVVADSDADTLTLVAGTNMTITTSADTITLTAASASGASESFAIAMAVAL